MINQIISEIRMALEHKLYMVALTSALTLPDVCGKAEFEDSEPCQNKRYKKWFDEHIGDTEQCKGEWCKECSCYGKDTSKQCVMPYLNGEIVYSLRCQLLHQSTPSIENKVKIDKFVLRVGSKDNPMAYVTDSSCCSEEKPIKSFKVSLHDLCYKLCVCAEYYYNQNKDKFDFIKYEIEDVDKRRFNYLKGEFYE